MVIIELFLNLENHLKDNFIDVSICMAKSS